MPGGNLRTGWSGPSAFRLVGGLGMVPGPLIGVLTQVLTICGLPRILLGELLTNILLCIR